ncbi:hypothetical protein DC522_31010, partial [Microvirga sp. KLBC 81]
MARGPKPIALSLTLPERETLQALVRRRSTHQDVAMRARRDYQEFRVGPYDDLEGDIAWHAARNP